MMKVVLALVALVAVASAQVLSSDCLSQSTVIDTFNPDLYPDFTQTAFRFTFVPNGAFDTIVGKPLASAPGSNLWGQASTTFSPSPGEEEILGGNRDINLYLDVADVRVNNDISANIAFAPGLGDNGRNTFNFAVAPGLRGIFEIQWDGSSETDSSVLNTDGLGGINYAGFSDSIFFELLELDLNIQLRLEAYEFGTDAVVSSQFNLDNADAVDNLFRVDINFDTDFTVEAGSSTAREVFSNLGALRLWIFSLSDDVSPFDGTIVNLGVNSGACIYKHVSKNLVEDNDSLPAIYANFYGSNDLSGNCNTDGLTIGDTVQFGVEVFAQGTATVSFNVFDTISTDVTRIGDVRVESFGSFPVSIEEDRSAGNVIDIDFSIDFGVGNDAETEIIDIFFQATIDTSAVSLSQCSGSVSNTAFLRSTFELESNSVSFCAQAMPNLDIQPKVVITSNPGTPNVNPGTNFTIESVIRNPDGNFNMAVIAANEAVFTVTAMQAGVSLNSESMGTFDTVSSTPSGGRSWSRTYNNFAVGEEVNTITIFDVAADYDGGQIEIECCWSNENTGVPDFCEKAECVRAFIDVREESDPRICKRGKLVRQLIYNVDYFNVGDGPALDVVIRENIPAGTTFNSAESDGRWNCAGSECIIEIDVLGANVAECAMFVVDINDNTPVCTDFDNTATIEYNVNQRTSIDWYEDDITTFHISQYGCPLPPAPTPPPEPECCECFEEPMCPCPKPDPCDECMPKDECGSGKGKSTTINFDFNGKDMAW